jgi:hypothetical protein
MSDTAFVRINPFQERQIESVHRGFLFQHLYAVGCLLSAESAGVAAVIVEGDEDVEVVRKDLRDYVQIKTRSEPLVLGDLKSALVRFDQIRVEHSSEKREGSARFFFVSNQPPGPGLAAQLNQSNWPKDVHVLWPGQTLPEGSAGLPPAWSDISEATRWCVDKAQLIPFRRLSPETMVWKLAAVVMLAASGGDPFQDHTFTTSHLPSLFEQLVIWLQDFPEPPDRYFPQANEPDLASEERLRIIAGFSGAGKTTWASQAALHSQGMFIYFDVGETPGPAIPALLAKEVAARLAASMPEVPLRDILLPDASGTESLRLLDVFVQRQGVHPVIVIDNAHQVSANVLRSIISVTTHLRFVLLCQPSGSIQDFETVFGVQRRSLEGWDDDAVVAVVTGLGATGSPDSISRLRKITSGMPLYVESAARVAVNDYNGNIGELCDAISNQTHTQEIAQEIILSKVFSTLPENIQAAVAVMSFCEVSLSQKELNSLLGEALKFTDRDVATAIRVLRPMGIVLTFGDGQLKAHDSIRIIGKRKFDSLGSIVSDLALKSLGRILLVSLQNGRDTKRLCMLIRTLAARGDYTVLVGLAGEEMFHELGIDGDIWGMLEDAAKSATNDLKLQFDALDGLVFRSLKMGEPHKVMGYLNQMERLLEISSFDVTDRMSFLAKRMSWQAQNGDVDAVTASLDTIEELMPNDAIFRRIFKYNTASALWHLDRPDMAEGILRELVQDYYKALGITSAQVFGQTARAIHEIVKVAEDYYEESKRFADTLAFHAKALARWTPLQKSDKLYRTHFHQIVSTRIQSMKFYQIVGAYDSLVSVGMDVVDDHLTVGDNFGAKDFSEQFVMPAVKELDIPVNRIFVQSQYAVVMARCGEQEEAESILDRLRPYYAGANDEERAGLMLNEKLVQDVKIGNTKR